MSQINDAFNAMPVNTRWLMLGMLVVTVGGNFGMVPLKHMYFEPELVLKFQVGGHTRAQHGARRL
jgi:hypothetical protein